MGAFWFAAFVLANCLFNSASGRVYSHGTARHGTAQHSTAQHSSLHGSTMSCQCTARPSGNGRIAAQPEKNVAI
jgi:hypothetical protein